MSLFREGKETFFIKTVVYGWNFKKNRSRPDSTKVSYGIHLY